MKRSKASQVVPSLIMAGAAAVPIITAIDILTHTPGGGSGVALQPSTPVAVAPKRSSSTAQSFAPGNSSGTRTYAGSAVNQPYGPVQATVTITGTRVTDVAISAPQDNGYSSTVNQQAIPLLRQETLQAQSAQINLVSGATLTSQAYIQSLQSALSQAQHAGNAPSTNNASPQTGNSASGSTAQTQSIRTRGDD